MLYQQSNIKLVVFSYNREQMLEEVLNHLSQFDVDILIVDDCSDFDIYRFNSEAAIYQSKKNLGKKGFFKQWQIALQYLLEDKTDEDLYIFMPDDFLRLDVKRIIETANKMNNNVSWLINLINDGRKECFGVGNPKPTQIAGKDFLKVNWTDCGFFCNTRTLERLRYWIEDIDQDRWVRNESLSSGVGMQLTQRLKHNTRIYLPLQSFAYHGEHESKMNKEERKKNPLISKH